MIIRAKGIVIREQIISDYDRLVTVLTDTNGVIKAFVNGGRNIKNKNTASTGLLCYSDFSINKTKKDVYRIQEATSIEAFFSLREDLLSLSLAQYFAEIIFELAPREEKSDDFLRLILNSIYLIVNKKRDLKIIKSAFELRLLCLAGYMPNLIACQNCAAFESEFMFFRTTYGDLFCKDCRPDGKSIKTPIGVVTAMRYICYCETKKLFNFALSNEGVDKLNYITESYLKIATNRRFKTLDFYKVMAD